MERMGFGRKKRIGDLLVEKGKITLAQLQNALAEQKAKGGLLGDVIVDLGYVTSDDMLDILSDHIGIKRVSLNTYPIDIDVLKSVPESMARKNNLVPIGMSKDKINVIIVAMADPLDIMAIDDVSIRTNMEVEPLLCKSSEVSMILDKYYGKDQVMAVTEAFKKEQQSYEKTDNQRQDDGDAQIESSPIVQLVNNIIEQAARQRASDIHIEPFEHSIRVRFRIDGSLVEHQIYDKALYSAMIARIKIMSNMDISEKRKPQDGRITIIVDKSEYDIRVSALPTCYGEKVVMRLALKAGFNRKKEDLGLRPDDMKTFDDIFRNPHGIILVTGPTGSGKSTTLYTALSELNKPDVNIITVEDPVEANIDGINQVMVNAKADLTFASALRSILRQDPDIIMIGEIRDGETAGIAVQASITGHLVVSTLHTNNTGASVARLVDMGIEPYLLSDSLVGIIAQRLVRKLCPKCKVSREATDDEKKILGLKPDWPFYIFEPNPDGCDECNHIGYYGRVGVYEIMPITRNIKRMINARKSADELNDAAVAEGMHTLRAAASQYVIEGVTTFSEMMKITYNVDEDEEEK